MTNSLRSILLAAGAVLTLANSVHASQVGYLREAPSADHPFAAGAFVEGAGHINSWNGRAGTLDFELSLNGVNGNYFDLLSYCGDPTRGLAVGPIGGQGFAFNIVSMQDFGYSAGDIDSIEKLWALAYLDSKTSATKAAAFQFLLWEYIADPIVDFATGMIPVEDASVLGQAQAWNGQLSNASANAALQVLDGHLDGRQSFFLEQRLEPLVENPEPATYVLIGAGLVAVAYCRRKR